MKQEDKDLLLKDLCARLPYSVKVLCLRDFNRKWYNLKMVDIGDNEVYLTTDEPYTNRYTEIEAVKPYLFPLSSMTEGQMKELEELCSMYTPDDDYHPYAHMGIKVFYKHVLDDNYKFSSDFNTDIIDWFNKNHFDYRGLIPKGSAIDATGLNIY